VERARCPSPAIVWLEWGFSLLPYSGPEPAQNPGSQSVCACTKASVNRCSEYEKLSSRVDEMLKKLAETTSLQLEIFRSKKPGEFMRVDKELELMVGEKERRIGALQQHVAEHQCHEREAA